VNNIVDSVSDSKEFCFSEVDVGCMMSYFGNDFLFSASMRNQDGNVVFITHICYNKYHVSIDNRIFIDVVQFVLIGS